MARASPTLNLRLGEEIFPVKKTVLFKKLLLFQENPALLSADDFQVKTSVPSEHFEGFVRIIEGEPPCVSEFTCDSFWRLSEEFRFEFLAAACTAFLASKEYFVETASVLRPRVTITVGTQSTTYESLKSYDEIRSFALDLTKRGKDCIVIEGMKGKGNLIQTAVEAVYGNTVSDLGLTETTKPFLAMALWEIQSRVNWDSIDTMIYCLNRLNEMAPSAFDKAKILLLSQSDRICRDDYQMNPMKDSIVIMDAIEMLKTEKNGRMNEAQELLAQLRKTGRFASLLGEPYGTGGPDSAHLSALRLAVGNPNAFGEDGSLTVATPQKADTRVQGCGVPGDKPSWFRRLFVSWFRPQSVHDMYAPIPVPGLQGGPVVFPCDIGGSGGFTGAPPPITRPVVDINWFK
jgi:hypothetical protein